MAKRDKAVRIEDLRVTRNGSDRSLLRLELDIPDRDWNRDLVEAIAHSIYVTITGRQQSRFRRILEALR